MLGVLVLAGCGRDQARTAFQVPGERRPRVVVEVLNASGAPGLARTGTRVLRRAGIDVVYYGNASTTGDSTRILVRRGTAAVGDRIRQILGTGKVELQPDSTRLLDASVLLGPDFSPRLDFHP
ncbi:MAG: LytR C-terminal domain-containing protein [Gemmatimonadales bacterium]